MAFDWSSVVNGLLAESTKYQFVQGETVLFRSISAAVEATMRLDWNGTGGPDFLIVSTDGFPVPLLRTTDTVIIPGGARTEFMVKFDKPGSFTLRRQAWAPGEGTEGRLHGVEACNATFGIELETCISYDAEQLIATVDVLPSDEPIETSLPTSTPEYHEFFKKWR